jgi:PIN domain nuclease of toxin-antitoxin system
MQFGEVARFSRTARASLLQSAQAGDLRVSVISVWEVGMLEAKGRLELKMACAEWIKQALATPGLSLPPLTAEIAIESSRLPGRFYGDPADRILVATARMTGARLLTKNPRLVEYGRQRHAPVLAA